MPWMSPEATMLREISHDKRVSMIKLNSRDPRIVRFMLTDNGIDRGLGTGRHGWSFCGRHRMTLWSNVAVCYTIIRMYLMPQNHTLNVANTAGFDVLCSFKSFLKCP